jgi:hypothetical protein
LGFLPLFHNVETISKTHSFRIMSQISLWHVIKSPSGYLMCWVWSPCSTFSKDSPKLRSLSTMSGVSLWDLNKMVVKMSDVLSWSLDHNFKTWNLIRTWFCKRYFFVPWLIRVFSLPTSTGLQSISQPSKVFSSWKHCLFFCLLSLNVRRSLLWSKVWSQLKIKDGYIGWVDCNLSSL